MLDDSQIIFNLTRWYLASFFTAVAIFYTLRILYLKRSSNLEMVFPGERYCSTWWNHIAFRFFRVMIWFICLLRCFSPNVDQTLFPIAALQNPLVISSGLIFLTLGFLATISIHIRFCFEWRSGIDPRGPESIMTEGIYRYSRNPMFIGVAISQLGFFLALPSVFSLVCLLVGITALYRQTLSEEAHLSIAFPITYSQYCQQVPRWL